MSERAIPRLTRAEFAARLAAGQEFRNAYLYEAQHGPKSAEFYLVQLSPTLTVYKRRIK